ncbi:MAG: helix-turn-helix domain-containing protein [Variovorax sp.]|nr:helix-turn-helix domain-containing protein [Variovorax sp.]
MDPSLPGIRSWSTDEVGAALRLDYFADAVSSSLTPMSVRRATSGPFRAHVRMAELGAVAILQTGGSEHTAVRAHSEIAQSGEHSYHLIVNRGASCDLEHRGGIRLSAGDAVLVDSRYGHRFVLGENHAHTHVKLSPEWLRTWVPNPDLLLGRALPRDSTWARALVAFVSELSPELALTSPLPGKILADQVGSLLALTAHELGGTNPLAPSSRAGLRERIHDCVAQRCTELELDAEQLAASLNISVRTLHRALAAHGETLGGILVAARCDTALRMLESPAMDRLTLEQVGRRAGFCNPSHFSKTMRSRFGLNPGQLRNRR